MKPFKDHSTPASLARAVYKYTDCGAWVQFMDANNIELDKQHAPWFKVDSIRTGSIVEGVDECTEVHEVYSEREFWEALDSVEDEASTIWNATHGCETCDSHYNFISIDEGVSPVWPSCPDCGGHGISI